MSYLSEVTYICCVLVCLSGNLGYADIISWFLVRIFSSLFEKQVIMSIHKVPYFKFNADIEIANIFSVLLYLSGNGGCVHVACLVEVLCVQLIDNVSKDKCIFCNMTGFVW